jgi:nitrate/nitrite-specific signal transduction histidine kinase
VLSAIISILLASLLMLILTKPLLDLRRVALSVANGDLTSRTKIESMDEIGQVSQAVNLMIDRLVVGQQKLRRSNRRLEAINKVITAASRETALQEVLDAALRTTVQVMKRQTGWIFLKDPTDLHSDEYHLASHYGVDPHILAQLSDSTVELCSCRQQLVQGHIPPQADRYICSLTDAAGNSLSHISIPLATHEETFGIMNIVWPEGEGIPTMIWSSSPQSACICPRSQPTPNCTPALVEKEAIRQALLQALVEAQEGERANLARELHDGAGQSLTSLLIRLKILQKKTEPAEIEKETGQLCDMVVGDNRSDTRVGLSTTAVHPRTVRPHRRPAHPVRRDAAPRRHPV